MTKDKQLIVSTISGLFIGVVQARSNHAQTIPCPSGQVQVLTHGCEDRGWFGEVVSSADDRLAVGQYDVLGGRVEAYVLDVMSGRWQFDAELRSTDLDPSDAFGHAVALHQDEGRHEWMLAVGSPSKSNLATSAGKAYVFAPDEQGVWMQVAEVLPRVTVPYAWFGNIVAWANAGARGFLVVGAPGSISHELPGSVFLFERDGRGGWVQHSKLDSPTGGRPDGAYGFAIDAAENDGDSILVVGEPVYALQPHQDAGTVYFYRFDEVGDMWTLEGQFQSPTPFEQDEFAWSVSVGAVHDQQGITHRAVVGCPNDGALGGSLGPGAAFVYVRSDSGTWSLEQRLEPPYSNPTDQQFGWSVDIEKDCTTRIFIGGPNDDSFGTDSGSAFIFKRDQNGVWIPVQRLFGEQADAVDYFGWDAALGNGASEGMAVVGALSAQCEGGNQTDIVGAVYSFDLEPGSGSECPPPVIRLQKVPECESGPGGELEVRWFQATPDRSARIAILYARQTGNFAIPNGNPCAGLPLGLGSQQLQVAFAGSAGQFGAGRLKTNIPRAACGGYLQLLDINRCELSNVVRIE